MKNRGVRVAVVRATSVVLSCFPSLLLAEVPPDPSSGGPQEPSTAEPTVAVVSADSVPLDSVQQAEALAESGYRAYENGSYQQAVRLYERAHALVPSSDILFNLARIYDRHLGQPDRAASLYTQVAAEENTTEDLRKQASERAQQLRAASEVVAVSAPPPSLKLAERRASVALRTESGHDKESHQAGAWTNRQLAGLSIGTLGVVAVGTGVALTLSAQRRDEVGGAAAMEEARDARTFARLGYAVGGFGILAGAAFFLWPEREESSALEGSVARQDLWWRWTPTVGPRSVGARLKYRW